MVLVLRHRNSRKASLKPEGKDIFSFPKIPYLPSLNSATHSNQQRDQIPTSLIWTQPLGLSTGTRQNILPNDQFCKSGYFQTLPTMVKPLIYLDTSVLNFVFADDAPEKQEITLDFFENYVGTGMYDAIISVYVLDEIIQTPAQLKRSQLEGVITEYGIPTLPPEPEDEIGRLAALYLEQGVLPPKKTLRCPSRSLLYCSSC